MDYLNTYLMMQALSSVGGTTGLGTNNYSGSVLGTANNLSFRNILQNIQNAQTNNSASASAVSAGATMDQIFEEAAKKYGIDANLLKAVGKAESDFNASAVSSAGAAGVMQLMPATAKSLGVTDPYNARQNIMGGAKYLSQMLDRYDGNVKLALAAYNAGPGNVDKYGGVPPFKETQNYVSRVLGYAGESITAYGTVPGILNGNTSAANLAGQNTAAAGAAETGTVEIKTDTLLTLLNLMRAQMSLRMFGSGTSSSGSAGSLFSL